MTERVSVGATASFTRPVAHDEIAPVLVAVVQTTPGVTGLAPTLSTAGLRAVISRRDTDGIQLIIRSGLVEVDINVATAGTRPARAVAHEIQDRVRAELRSRGLQPGSIAVSVLTVGAIPEPGPATPDGSTAPDPRGLHAV